MSPFRRLWNAIRRADLDEDLQQELKTHLALIEEEERRHGASVEDARRVAASRFGQALGYREQALDGVVALWFEHALKDLAFAVRRLLRAPAFTLASILTLALAIGANAAIFAVVYRVVVNPLPYGDSGRLVAFNNSMPSRNVAYFNTLTTQLYYQYLDRAKTIDGIAIYRTDEQTLTGEGNPERIRVTRATPSLASVLRVAPLQGRWFTDAEGTTGAAQVAVLGHGLWVRRYGESAGVLGRVITLDGVPTTVVGVMRASFAFPDPGVDVWTAMTLTRAAASENYSFAGVGRLRQGVTTEDARTELNVLTAGLGKELPGSGYDQLVSTPTILIEATVGRISTTLWILLASVGLVLLVACANIANLFLVRSDARQREVAVRRALGAGNRAIARYFLSESILLSIAGGGLGLGLAWAAVRVLVAYGPANLPRLQEVQLDGVSVMFTGIVSLLASLAFGAIPLFRFTPVAASLHESGRGNTASRSRHRVRQLLMGGQVALALMLLVSSGLMLRSFQQLRAVHPGFDATSGLTFRIGLPRSDYPERGRIVAAHRAILDKLAAVTGVKAVSAASCLPLEGCGGGGPLFIQGRVLPPGSVAPIVLRRAVAAGFFEALGMRIVRGRSISKADIDRNEAVVVVAESVARTSFQGQDPIGQRIRLGNPSLSSADPGWLTIVGVVANAPFRELAEPISLGLIYMPLFGTREVNLQARIDAMSYVVRTSLPPLSMVSALRSAVAEVDPKLPLAQVRTLQELLDGASAQMAFTMVLLAIAAGVALLLGVIGIYGVMSYIVSQRTGEIGVRLALGAGPRSVAAMIVREGGIVSLVGVVIGLVSSLAVSRLIQSLLYGVSPRDPGVLAATTAILMAVALAACWLPARRAARLSPLEALRTE